MSSVRNSVRKFEQFLSHSELTGILTKKHNAQLIFLPSNGPLAASWIAKEKYV